MFSAWLLSHISSTGYSTLCKALFTFYYWLLFYVGFQEIVALSTIPASTFSSSLRFSIHLLACIYLLTHVVAKLRICRDAYLVWSQQTPTRLSPRRWLPMLVLLVFLVIAAPIIYTWLKLGHYLYLCLLALTYVYCFAGVTAKFLMP
jgi:hypothetical protein